MIEPGDIPPVDIEEILARYILRSGYLRKDKTIKQDAFMPHPYQELSVTRHRDANEEEIWSIGKNVAIQQDKTLYGRGDIKVSSCILQHLSVLAVPVTGNPNHADITGWPETKPEQKMIAQELAATSVFAEPR